MQKVTPMTKLGQNQNRKYNSNMATVRFPKSELVYL